MDALFFGYTYLLDENPAEILLSTSWKSIFLAASSKAKRKGHTSTKSNCKTIVEIYSIAKTRNTANRLLYLFRKHFCI